MHCCLGWKMVQPLWKTVLEVPQKIKNGTTIWSSHPLSGCISKGTESRDLNRCLCTKVPSSFIHSSQSVSWKFGENWTNGEDIMEAGSIGLKYKWRARNEEEWVFLKFLVGEIEKNGDIIEVGKVRRRNNFGGEGYQF